MQKIFKMFFISGSCVNAPKGTQRAIGTLDAQFLAHPDRSITSPSLAVQWARARVHIGARRCELVKTAGELHALGRGAGFGTVDPLLTHLRLALLCVEEVTLGGLVTFRRALARPVAFALLARAPEARGFASVGHVRARVARVACVLSRVGLGAAAWALTARRGAGRILELARAALGALAAAILVRVLAALALDANRSSSTRACARRTH